MRGEEALSYSDNKKREEEEEEEEDTPGFGDLPCSSHTVSTASYGETL